jgi:hypothetical protein
MSACARCHEIRVRTRPGVRRDMSGAQTMSARRESGRQRGTQAGRRHRSRAGAQSFALENMSEQSACRNEAHAPSTCDGGAPAVCEGPRASAAPPPDPDSLAPRGCTRSPMPAQATPRVLHPKPNARTGHASACCTRSPMPAQATPLRAAPEAQCPHTRHPRAEAQHPQASLVLRQSIRTVRANANGRPLRAGRRGAQTEPSHGGDAARAGRGGRGWRSCHRCRC